ncbi:nuclear transcription factor Y subunit B-10 [Carex littledalei]|uniref:Nuclear transcription factor Y subunit B-10 n=1 Tax=Carex littledalei TaxID=544730 RepID=A0A833Q861_9POAL|nr:nuclear transcription factor Y subunit B-10 [Carex littledalei]
MDAPSSSILSNTSSAPPAQNEPVIQEDEQNDKTAEENELAAAQQRIDALPTLKILSIMQKALPKDAHIDADVDEVIRACVAKFSGVLTKEAKQQQALARHKVLQSEDIINALQKLGFEESSTALSLFFDRFMGATDHSQSQQVQFPVHTSGQILTEMQQQGNINVPNQGITRGDPTSSIQYWGNATMPPPPSPALSSWPASNTMPFLMNIQPPSTPMQQQGPVLWGPLNFTPFSGDALFPQPIPPRSDERFSQQVPMQMASWQQNVGGYGTNMPADGILGTGAVNTSDSPLDQEMTDADIAYVLDLLKDKRGDSDVP